ncbi:MAG: exopolysaccharide biosynthesis polyprenyl glycosylphosphotransferase [Flavobacteriaceae bacterium]
MFLALFKSTVFQENFNQQLIFIVLVWIFSALIAKFYNFERNLTYTKQLQRFLLFSLLWALLFFLIQLILAPFEVNNSNVLFFYLVVFFSKAISLSTLYKLRSTRLRYQQNILVYDSDSGKRFINDIKQLKRTGLNLFVGEKELFDKKSLEALKIFINEKDIESIFLPMEAALKKSLNHIIKLSWNKEVEVKFISDYNSPILGKGAMTFGLTKAVNHLVSPLDNRLKRIQKRVFDILFSSFVIVFFLSWFIPLVGLFILIDSKGPLFFIQHRPGRYGKPFRCLKLRSMVMNINTEKSALRNDARITRVGKVIRRTSIDELPQFFNVFWGDMSVVGPRPNLNSQNDHYTQVFDEYHKRMYLKPGITGLAQVSGARGGIEDDIEMKHRVKYDIFYIRNWSFALDIKIIIRTVLNVIRGEEKAY